MIWGETNDQWWERVTTKHLWFAWRPVVLTDGHWAWLEYGWRWRSVSACWSYEAAP